jgi:hypothetical protein
VHDVRWKLEREWPVLLTMVTAEKELLERETELAVLTEALTRVDTGSGERSSSCTAGRRRQDLAGTYPYFYS